MTEIVVGSRNPVKIRCVKNIFSKYFENIKIAGEEVNSGVSFQPKTEEETIIGAESRAEEILRKYKPDFAIGVEGGTQHINKKLYTFAWICIKSKERKIGLGRTASFPLPKRIEKMIRAGKELGEANDILFGVENSKQKMGAVGLLSKERLNRTKLYEQGVMCALLPFLNQKLYF